MVEMMEDVIRAKAPWRNADLDTRQEYFNWTVEQITERLDFGSQKYGELFKGNPPELRLANCCRKGLDEQPGHVILGAVEHPMLNAKRE
tara:strand:+ start:13494 stop:13760 length:267 start_codon:yes stop_codon:yes gene_type:complete